MKNEMNLYYWITSLLDHIPVFKKVAVVLWYLRYAAIPSRQECNFTHRSHGQSDRSSASKDAARISRYFLLASTLLMDHGPKGRTWGEAAAEQSVVTDIAGLLQVGV